MLQQFKELYKVLFGNDDIDPEIVDEGVAEWKPYIEDNLAKSIRANTCPICGSQGFLPGPRGGMSQNIMCASDACSARFNVTMFPLGEIKVEHTTGAE